MSWFRKFYNDSKISSIFVITFPIFAGLIFSAISVGMMKSEREYYYVFDSISNEWLTILSVVPLVVSIISLMTFIPLTCGCQNICFSIVILSIGTLVIPPFFIGTVVEYSIDNVQWNEQETVDRRRQYEDEVCFSFFS